MTATPLTWSRGSGLVMFTLAIPTGGNPAAAIARAAGLAFELIPTVGAIRNVSLSTYDAGEDAFEWAGSELQKEIVTRAIEAQASASRAMFDCDLVCKDAGGGQIHIPDGMAMWIDRLQRENPTTPLEVTIGLDTDIYAASTWGEDRDNRVLARLNAPSFNQFFQQFTNRSQATVVGVDADDYLGQVDEHGFVLS